MKIQIVIPVLNDVQALSELMNRLFSVMDMAGSGRLRLATIPNKRKPEPGY